MTKKPTEPIRHAHSSRNLRKALHHAENAVEEAKYLSAEMTEISERLVKLCLKIKNRLRASAHSSHHSQGE